MLRWFAKCAWNAEMVPGTLLHIMRLKVGKGVGKDWRTEVFALLSL